MRPALALVLLAALPACTMSPETAARYCEDRARAARGPTGTIYAGFGTNGPSAGGEVFISTDYLAGRDPQMVYERCVYERSGQGPIRPLNLGR